MTAWRMSVDAYVLVARTPGGALEPAPLSPEAAARRDWTRFQELLLTMEQVAERERATRGQMTFELGEQDA